MDVESAINSLNDDCIFEILKWLNWASVLAFGVTNIRFYSLVLRHVHTQQPINGIIRFILDGNLSNIREFLERFGECFIHLDVDFAKRIIDMDIFQNIDGCLIFRCTRLDLRSDLVEDDEYDGYFQNAENNSISHILNHFNRSAENIIDTINNNQIQSLSNVSFTCSLALQTHTFNRIHTLFDNLDAISVNLFIKLRRGNMHLSHEIDYLTCCVQLKLELDLP